VPLFVRHPVFSKSITVYFVLLILLTNKFVMVLPSMSGGAI